MHFNTGYRDDCIPLVRRFADVFAGYDAVVTPSPSCAAMVRHEHPIVAALRGASAARRRPAGRGSPRSRRASTSSPSSSSTSSA